MGALFKSYRELFYKKHDAFKDLVQSRMVMDVEVYIKTSAGTPVKTGGMKAEVRHFKTDRGGYRVEAGKGYSATQEAGIRQTGKGAPTARFEHYTTSGTSAGWFHRAIAMMLNNKETYIEEATRAIGL